MHVSTPPSAELAELNELFEGMKETEMGIFDSLLTCGDRRDEELSLNRDSTLPTSPSDDCSSPEDEEVIMNFFEGYQSSGSAEEMTAIQGVENLSLEQCRSVTPECVSKTALKRATPPRSHTNVFKQAVATLVNQEPIRTIFKSEPIQSIFKSEPIQTMFKSEQTYINAHDLHRQDSKRSRSPTPQPVQVHLKPAASEFVFSENLMAPPAMTWQVSKRTKSSVQRIRGLEQVYICGHCDQRKTSTARCADGHVRIRCKCGGQHKDGKLRMHATWTLSEDNNLQSSEPEQVVEREWIFVDDTHTQQQQHQQAAIMCAVAS